ncbi:alpha-N-acetylglucosaminidase TIM-barrel domain-containing protein [Nocardioides sp. CCNWLW239]|uniref:alpha-N-acetylglucosaminidase TIM-barrel domain-containing protein n=1 Tax=Nocardioides sp. CCNWLW239 TaxID=3128902 RepID=UPI0030168D04
MPKRQRHSQLAHLIVAMLLGLIAATMPTIAASADPTEPVSEEPSEASSGPAATRPAREALVRMLGHRHAARFDLSVNPGGSDRYRVSARGSRIVVEGTNVPAVLMGVNAYLKKVAKADVSWTGTQVQVKGSLPVPSEPIEATSLVAHRFSGNDTEDGYSGPFRTFEDWRDLVDINAMHGVNEMFLPVGSEMVYYRLLQDYGYSEAEARAWIPSPVYQQWWLMQNMWNFTEPVTPELLQKRADLGRRIADYMRSMGITPVLPGYFGTVPTDFEVRNPGAVTVPQGTWSGLRRPDWLAPTHELFGQVADRFYEIQDDVLGASTMYKMDLLHEGGTPGSIPVGKASAAVQDALDAAHPGATWVALGWQSNPRPETLDAIDRGRMLIVDGLADRNLDPQRETQWKGTPYAFGSIWNFGGNSTVGAPIKAWNERFWDFRSRPNSALNGIAILPEASYNNAVAMEFLAELPWQTGPVDLDAWFAEYADARYGATDPAARAAWKTLQNTAYSIPPNNNRSAGTSGLFAAVPALTATRASNYTAPGNRYDPTDFAAALPSLLKVRSSLRASDTYRHDLAEIARQVVTEYTHPLLVQIRQAYAERDIAEFDRLTDAWIEAIDTADRISATRADQMVGPWLAKARAFASSPEEATALEHDARRVLTSWTLTLSLTDYAYRDWSGLLDSYYAPRWERYFDSLRDSLRTGEEPAAIDWLKVADEWSRATDSYPTEPEGDTYAEAARALEQLSAADFGAAVSLRPTGTIGEDPGTVALTVVNNNPFAALENLSAQVTAPDGITASAAGELPSRIEPGGSATVSWTVAADADLPSEATEAAIGVEVTYDQQAGTKQKTARAVLPVDRPGRIQLSDVPFSSSRNHDGEHPVARDTVTPATPSGNGAPIMLDGTAYSKGLGTNAAGEVRFELGQGCQRFTTLVGIDDAMNHAADGDVVVEVWGDGRRIRTTPVLRSGLATTGTEAIRLDVDITGVRQLRIVIDRADGNRSFDAASFGLPTLTCSGTIPTPLSEGKLATASSSEGAAAPARAVDAKLHTNWLCNPAQCAGKPAWLQVDLGAEREISGIRVTPYYADRRSYRYTVEGSVDGITFTPIAAKNVDSPQTDVGDWYPVSGSFRYVRVTGTGNTSNAYTLHLQELAVYGS